MYSIKMKQPKELLEKVKKAGEIHQLMVTGYKISLRRSKSRALKRLREKPGRPKYPIKWTRSKHPEDASKAPNTRWGYYSRQKAAFFATDGFGKGIPTRRTNRLTKGWRGVYTPGLEETVYKIENPVSYTQFVQGEHQQEFHRITGWNTVEKVVLEETPILEYELEEMWITVMDDFAGVK